MHPPPKQVQNSKGQQRPIISSDRGGCTTHLPTVVNRDALFNLWKRAIRGNRQAQQSLESLIQRHPGLETILKALSGDRDAVVSVRADSLGTDANGIELAPNWEPQGRRGSWVAVVSGGLPGLGKHR